MTTKALDKLKDDYNTLCSERQETFNKISERVISGGDKITDEEKRTLKAMDAHLDSAKEDYETQRDFEAMADTHEPISTIEREVESVSERMEGEAESKRAIARDISGREGVQAYDERAGNVLEKFEEMSRTGSKGITIEVNPHRAHNFKMLRDMGVSTRDFVSAVRSGHQLIAERNKQGNLDVRSYNITTDTQGGDLVPTFWDDTLYLFASYIGGVQAAGAEIIPVMGPNPLKLPKVLAYGTAIPIVAEAVDAAEVQETVDTTDLQPRAYRGYSGETDELMRSAVINTRMMLVLRGLSRALQLGKEDDFHDGNGTSKPKGILNGVAAGRITKTGGNTTDIRYQDLPSAMAKLDAEYHQPGRPGSLVALMHSAEFWKGIVAKVDTDGRPLYPMHWLFGNPRMLFEAMVVFSHKMAQAPAANALLAVVGNMMDAYVIATTGTQEIEVSDDVKFLSWQRTYRIQEYCDGQVRDDKALGYVQSAA